MFPRLKKKYRVLVEGENLLIQIQWMQRFGCFTTRFVEAEAADEAAKRALALVWEELDSTGTLLNEADDPPVIKVAEIERIRSFKDTLVPGRGFTFFPESAGGE